MFLRPFVVDNGNVGGAWKMHDALSMIVKGKIPVAIHDERNNVLAHEMVL
jgi:hypothetical protein